jgi:AraC-like DNA-binding protein
VSVVYRPSLAEGVAPVDCCITTEAFLLGETMFAWSSVVGIGNYHNPGSSPLRDGADLLVIDLVLTGRDTGYNGAQFFDSGPGDIIVLDPTRGLTFNAAVHSTSMTFVVPRRLLQELLGKRDAVFPVTIPGSSLVGQILTQAMQSTWERLPGASNTQSGELSGLLLGAVAGLLRGADRRGEDPAVDHATLNTICAYIERNLGNPDLGPDHLCKRFCCSRARLYRLFAPLDGVSNHIRKARLERCRAALMVAPRRVNISDIALEWGFGNISHFNRLFRETFGHCPGEVRGMAGHHGDHPAQAARAVRLRAPEYRDWLARL